MACSLFLIMTKKYYLGTTELIFEGESLFGLTKEEDKFSNPVLEVEKKIFVKVTEQKEFTVPDFVPHQIQDAEVWETDEGEIRAYKLDKQRKKEIISVKKDKEIIIYVSELEKIRRNSFLRMWCYVHLERILLENNAVILHAASIIYKGQAILFTAPSGTGKSTQTDLWHQYREGVTDLNGDRTILQYTQKGWFACGLPLAGSSMRSEQAAVPIRAIVVIQQAKQDCVEEMSLIERITAIYSEVTIASYCRLDVKKSLELIEKLVSAAKIFRLKCTMNESAVNVLEERLWRK